jgi:RHS repeat-associated protein
VLQNRAYAYDALGRRTVSQDAGRSAMRTLYDSLGFEVLREGETFNDGSFTTRYSEGIQRQQNTGTEGSRYRWISEEAENLRTRSLYEDGYGVAPGRFTGISVTLYGRGEAVAVNRSASTGSRGGAAYLGKDILGSVRSTTNEYGSLEDRYEYDAFGKPYKGDLTTGMNLGYTGKPYDTATGLYNYGYRDYQPEVARFTTVDPIRDGANWFAYVNNDPVNYTDPWGLESFVGWSTLDGSGGGGSSGNGLSPTLGEPVYATHSGTVFRSGWQDVNDHSKGMGWRTSIDRGDGYYDQYGHLEPSSTLPQGTEVNEGDMIGRMADPTNGYSTAPHVHIETRNSITGEAADPETKSPFAGASQTTSQFGDQEDGLRNSPHSGVDHVPAHGKDE